VQPRVPQSEIRKLQRTGLSLIERAKVLHTPRQKEETMTWQQITTAYMPALMIMVTVYIAAVSNNKRIDGVNNRIGDVNKCIDELQADFKEEIKALRTEMKDLRAELNTQIRDFRTEMKDLRTEMKEGFRKLEERFEHPIARP